MVNNIEIITLTLSLLLCRSITFGQGTTEKSWDKLNVQTIEVLGNTFSVGDTLTFTSGSLPNGDFLCTSIDPLRMAKYLHKVVNLSSGYTNYRFIIVKIRKYDTGLNSSTYLIIYIEMGKEKIPVWIDATIAITKKEILY